MDLDLPVLLCLPVSDQISDLRMSPAKAGLVFCLTEVSVNKEEILNLHRNRFPVNDWRRSKYDEDKWQLVTMAKDWDKSKQHPNLKVGEHVIVHVDFPPEWPGSVFILHERLMSPTLIHLKYLKF